MDAADFFQAPEFCKSLSVSSDNHLDMRTDSADSVERGHATEVPQAVSDLSWSNVCYAVGGTKILTDCWGHVSHGQVCAVMGPSGAGKSSLLNVLAGRCASRGNATVTGVVKVGSRTIDPVKYRQHIAYVMQDDCVLATTTPREALLFSAVLRLPSTVPRGEIVVLVDQLLNELGLVECADVCVGSALVKGISGGQRKRTSVGVELITDPAILLLDEPTTGLDSHSASNFVKLLKYIAGKNNSAILCTIHQPSSEVFALFDTVIFMKAGRVFYQGPVSGINTYYADHGQKCPENYNPADFVMNLCQPATGDALELLFIPENNQRKATDSAFPTSTKAEHHFATTSSLALQFAQLTHRELVSIYRNPAALAVRYGSTIALSILFGLVFLGTGSKDNGDITAFNAHVGLIANCMFSTMLGSSQSLLLVFPFERPLFLREYSTGTYSTTAYMLSKLCLEIPLTLLEVMILFMFAKTMSDLQGNYFQLIAVAFGLAMTSNSLAMIQGALFADIKQAATATLLIFLPQVFYSGFFTRIDQIPQFVRWPQYLSALSYANKLIYLVEFDTGLKHCNTSPEAHQNCASIVRSNGQEPGLFWVNVVCLFALFACARVAAGAVLTHKARQLT